MGIDYRLVNLKTKSRFDLGKSGYELGQMVVGGAPLEPAALEDLINDWCDRPEWGEEEARAFAAWLAPRLIAFVGDVTASDLLMVNDCDDSETPFFDHPIVDSRYTDPSEHPPPCPACRSAEARGRQGLNHTPTCTIAPDREKRWTAAEWRAWCAELVAAAAPPTLTVTTKGRPMPSEPNATRFSELTAEAVFALYYAWAEVAPTEFSGEVFNGQKVNRADLFRLMQSLADEAGPKLGKRVLNPTEKRQAIRRGLEELAERGLVDVARDEGGGHRPVAVHPERLVMDNGGLVLAERS